MRSDTNWESVGEDWRPKVMALLHIDELLKAVENPKQQSIITGRRIGGDTKCDSSRAGTFQPVVQG